MNERAAVSKIVSMNPTAPMKEIAPAKKITPGKKVALAAALLLGASLACAQTWPTRSIRILVSIPPGGAPDILARILGDKLTQIGRAHV